MIRRIPRRITSQITSRYAYGKEFSTASPQPRGSNGKQSESKSGLSKIIVGSVFIGAAAMAAYRTGCLDKILGRDKHSVLELPEVIVDNENEKYVKHLEKPISHPYTHEHYKSGANLEQAEPEVGTQLDAAHLESVSDSQGEQENRRSDLTEDEEASATMQEKIKPEHPQQSVASADTISGISGELLNIKNPNAETNAEERKANQDALLSKLDDFAPEENETERHQHQTLMEEQKPEDATGKGVEPTSSLLDEYDLRDNAEETTTTSLSRHSIDGDKQFSQEKEAMIGAVQGANESFISEDGKLVLDFIQAIHAAEKRQADLDAAIFAKEKRMMKEKYEKELKDARVMELKYAEEAAMLDKELNKERTKAAAMIKSIQERAEEKLRAELAMKESEAETKLKESQQLARAELSAAIAREKASQIERMAEANLHINALCMAFYARSEEARQTHSFHKLALVALALEDALSKGLPVQKEVEALNSYLEGCDKDSLIGLVLSSIPEETRYYGTDTLLQLNEKFGALKGTIRHYNLIPQGGGGGILAHSLAHVASWLKVKEADTSGDGIESVINKIERYIAEGKLVEAADALEQGVRGSKAAEVVGDWTRRARNRAITEQALTLLRSYATSINLT